MVNKVHKKNQWLRNSAFVVQFSVIALIALVVLYAGQGFYDKNRQAEASIEHEFLDFGAASEISNALWSLRWDIANYAAADSQMKADANARKEATFARLEKALERFSRFANDEAETKLLDVFVKSFSEYKQRRPHFIELVDQNKVPEAVEYRKKFLLGPAGQASQAIDALSNYQKTELARRSQEQSLFGRKMVLIFSWIVGVGLCVLAVLNFIHWNVFGAFINREIAHTREQNNLQQELKDNSLLTEAIVENIPVGVFLKDVDDDYRVTLWNSAAERIFEVPRNSVIGKTTDGLWNKEIEARILADYEKVFDKKINVDLEEVFPTKTRGPINVRMRKVPLVVGSSEKSHYLLVICDDLTEQKKSHAIALQSTKMASLGEMAGGIAHEINNPLAIIQGKASQIIDQIESGAVDLERIKDSSAKIDAMTVRIAKIIKGLRSFSRNAENDPMERAKFSQVLEDSLELCKQKFKSKAVELRVKNEVDAVLECRPTQISQVLVNLLSNALDAIESLPEKWVSIESSVVDRRIQVTVTDSGKGIPPAVIDKIMQPFFTTKEVGKGTGLGLSISKGIIEDHKGRFYYDASSPNTRFVIELPIKS